jgi:diguanylate cyclase
MSIITCMQPDPNANGRQAVALLLRLGLDLSPVNFELMTLLIEGDRPEIKRRFALLPRPIDPQEWAAMARDFLPQHFQTGQRLTAALSLFDAATELRGILSAVDETVSGSLQKIEKAATVLQASPALSPAQLAHVLKAVTDACAAELEATRQVMQALDDWAGPLSTRPAPALSLSSTATQSVAGTLDFAGAGAGVGTATGAGAGAGAGAGGTAGSAAGALDVSRPVAAAPLVHGLAGRAALMGRMKAMTTDGNQLDGSSLLLCRLKGLEAYQRPAMTGARDFLLDTLGQQAGRLMSKEELASWIQMDELGMLVTFTDDLSLTDLGRRIGRILETTVRLARKRIPDLPNVQCRLGAASAFGAVTPAQLYDSARLALQRAEFRGDDTLVTTTISGRAPTDRHYEALYGRQTR